jgi:hypothetical protein
VERERVTTFHEDEQVLLFGQVNIIQGRANDRVISERKQIRKMKICLFNDPFA